MNIQPSGAVDPGDVTLVEDGNLLTRKTTSAAVESAPGSFYVTADSGTVDIYVNPSTNDDPAT